MIMYVLFGEALHPRYAGFQCENTKLNGALHSNVIIDIYSKPVTCAKHRSNDTARQMLQNCLQK